MRKAHKFSSHPQSFRSFCHHLQQFQHVGTCENRSPRSRRQRKPRANLPANNKQGGLKAIVVGFMSVLKADMLGVKTEALYRAAARVSRAGRKKIETLLRAFISSQFVEVTADWVKLKRKAQNATIEQILQAIGPIAI